MPTTSKFTGQLHHISSNYDPNFKLGNQLDFFINLDINLGIDSNMMWSIFKNANQVINMCVPKGEARNSLRDKIGLLNFWEVRV